MRLSSLIARATFFVGCISAGASLAACGSNAPPPRVVAKPADLPKKQADPLKVAVCNDQVDVADLFARHAAEFGSEAAVAQALPMTITGTVTVSGKAGTFEQSIDAKHVHDAIHLKGFERAGGTDDNGAWQLGNSGAVSRLRPDEMRGTDEWMFRRHYLSAFDPKRDLAVCHMDDAKRQIIVHEKIEALGGPRLVFDQDSAELIGAQFRGVDGQSSTRTFTWAARKGAAPRWPAQTTSQDGDGSTIEESDDNVGAAKPDAFALPASLLQMTWPKSGSVRVPMKLYGGEILIDVVVGGKKARALLDSGAGISIVEAGGKVADAFTSELEFGGQSATQKISFGIGELAEVDVGALAIKNIPAARVPIPMLDQFGPNRPDIVLGWSVFEGNAVRIDYARNELVFSRDSSSQHKSNSPAIDFRVLGDKIVAAATLGSTDGHTPDTSVQLQLDTGNAFTVSLNGAWAKKAAVPSANALQVSMTGSFSAGLDQTSTVYFRDPYGLGPIQVSNDIVEVSEGPSTGFIAGLIGNLAFARCAAIVIDVPNRKMWFDGPCDRTPARSRAWWTLAKSDDAPNAEHPWVVVSTATAAAADIAGIAPRDRIVAIDGRPVGLAFDFIGTFSKPVGTKVAIIVKRGTETKKLLMRLADPF